MALALLLDELNLLQCSLLHGEYIIFLDAEWQQLLQRHSEIAEEPSATPPSVSCCFDVRTDDSDIWFRVELLTAYPQDPALILVKGHNLCREEQERWQSVVKSKSSELEGTDVYQLVSQNLFPLLHAHAEEVAGRRISAEQLRDQHTARSGAVAEERYHALLTSHHLLSPAKRRALQKWSAELVLAGFAKVGHPGVIYCDGARGAVDDFVARVKAMQWLALRVRFVEPVPDLGNERGAQWVELQKVGEVVQEMRRIGREGYVLEMGIGSLGTGVSK